MWIRGVDISVLINIESFRCVRVESKAHYIDPLCMQLKKWVIVGFYKGCPGRDIIDTFDTLDEATGALSWLRLLLQPESILTLETWRQGRYDAPFRIDEIVRAQGEVKL